MSQKSKPILYDPQIIFRVQNFVDDNPGIQHTDIGSVIRHLQQRYPEYRRRKHGPFRLLVKQAIRIVTTGSADDDETLNNDQPTLDVTVEKTPPPKNVLNNIMNNLYNKPKGSKDATGTPKVGPGADAICISSDDDDEEEESATADSNSQPKALGGGEFSTSGSTDSTTSHFSSNGKTPVVNDNDNSNSLLTGHKRRRSTASRDDNPTQVKVHRTNKDQQSQFNAEISNEFSNSNADVPKKTKQPQEEIPKRKYKKVVNIEKSALTFQNLGGLDKVLRELCEILTHIKSPDVYYTLGLLPPNGILLHGTSGCGKTTLAHAIAGQLKYPLIDIPATELVAGISGESEERIRDVFEQATAISPCVLFIDEIDAISANRQFAQKDMERRIVSQLISCMSSLRDNVLGSQVLVIGATTRPDCLDPGLRRVGRFDHEIAIPIPNRKERRDILKVICKCLTIESKLDYDKIAELTPGYVGADLQALVSRAASFAAKRKWSEELQDKQDEISTVVDLDELDESTNVEKNQTEFPGDSKTIDSQKASISNEVNEVETIETPENEVNTDAREGSSEVTSSEDVPVLNDMEMITTSTEPVQSAENQTAIDEEKPMEVTTKKSPKKICEATLTQMINWLNFPPEIMGWEDLCITFEDFCEAIKVVQPSAKREGFITVPDVTWDDIGSLHKIRDELRLAILAPVKFPEKMERLGLSAPSGVLLCGPPGCGKTLIAKAVANEAGINFISVKGPELMNMYVGESERAVRGCFQRARNSAPCVIFFDEFDSLCPKRSDAGEGSSGVRVVNQLLTEMDGIEERKGVYIMAATNRPDIIDPAILRPGRLDTILYVGMPNEKDRIEILQAATKNRTKPLLDENVAFDELAVKTEGFTGADLSGLVRQASMMALKEALKNDLATDDVFVKMGNFKEALKLVRPSISEQDRKVYEKLRQKYTAPCPPV